MVFNISSFFRQGLVKIDTFRKWFYLFLLFSDYEPSLGGRKLSGKMWQMQKVHQNLQWGDWSALPMVPAYCKYTKYAATIKPVK